MLLSGLLANIKFRQCQIVSMLLLASKAICVVLQENDILIVAEEAGFYDEADTDHRVVFLVGEEPFTITAVVLQEKELVVALEDTVVELKSCIVVQLPAFTFDKVDCETKTSVLGSETRAHLVDAAVVEDIFVFRSVDNRYPCFAVDHNLRVNHYASPQAYAVP